MSEFFQSAWDVITTIVVNLRDPQKWQETLDKPGVFWPAVAALAFVIFAETGLFVGFFLPGDSLLVTVGWWPGCWPTRRRRAASRAVGASAR